MNLEATVFVYCIHRWSPFGDDLFRQRNSNRAFTRNSNFLFFCTFESFWNIFWIMHKNWIFTQDGGATAIRLCKMRQVGTVKSFHHDTAFFNRYRPPSNGSVLPFLPSSHWFDHNGSECNLGLEKPLGLFDKIYEWHESNRVRMGVWNKVVSLRAAATNWIFFDELHFHAIQLHPSTMAWYNSFSAFKNFKPPL